MSKVLVIEPYRIVQQAIAIALYPDNDVALMAGIPESLDVKDFDAVIVDAASLAEKDGFDREVLRKVRGWKLPVIWIEGEAAGEAGGQGNALTLQKPFSREALIGALGRCLGRPSGGKLDDRAATRAQASASEAVPKAAQFIDLTEVVEEAADANKPQQEKKR